jgi:hypothetical protein
MAFEFLREQGSQTGNKICMKKSKKPDRVHGFVPFGRILHFCSPVFANFRRRLYLRKQATRGSDDSNLETTMQVERET